MLFAAWRERLPRGQTLPCEVWAKRRRAITIAIERRGLCADGSVLWALWQHSLVRDADGEPAHRVSHCIDISQRKHAELALDHQATHDPLTGHPNRTLFLERLSTASSPAAATTRSSTRSCGSRRGSG